MEPHAAPGQLLDLVLPNRSAIARKRELGANATPAVIAPHVLAMGLGCADLVNVWLCRLPQDAGQHGGADGGSKEVNLVVDMGELVKSFQCRPRCVDLPLVEYVGGPFQRYRGPDSHTSYDLIAQHSARPQRFRTCSPMHAPRFPGEEDYELCEDYDDLGDVDNPDHRKHHTNAEVHVPCEHVPWIPCRMFFPLQQIPVQG
mmetsp:Transcript_145326/g.378066  ORF Transcript_145326/g.378066 Transcript_145326/m.378066 type:complete len:201 (-) Transcript_145326:821-1423(-)